MNETTNGSWTWQYQAPLLNGKPSVSEEMADELHDFDRPGLPSVAETGEKFVCLPPGEVESLRAVTEAARALDTAIGQWQGVALSPDVARAWIALEDALDGIQT